MDFKHRRRAEAVAQAISPEDRAIIDELFTQPIPAYSKFRPARGARVAEAAAEDSARIQVGG